MFVCSLLLASEKLNSEIDRWAYFLNKEKSSSLFDSKKRILRDLDFFSLKSYGFSLVSVEITESG
jgi:hypothetical protein